MRKWPFFLIGVHWSGPVFRIFWLGWWQVSYDISHAYYERWPHISIKWNKD